MFLQAALAVSLLMLDQAIPIERQAITVNGAPLREPEVIVAAEHLFVKGRYKEALELVRKAIGEAESDSEQDKALLANLYDCAAWISSKTPAMGESHYRQDRNAEGYAARATQLIPDSRVYWRDYTLLWMRRELDENIFTGKIDRIMTYNFPSGESATPLMAFESIHAVIEAKSAALLRTSIEFSGNDAIASSAERGSMPIHSDEQLIDGLMRERADDFEAWAGLWSAASSRRDGRLLFRQLTEHPSGDLHAVAASTLPMLENGQFGSARSRLISAVAIAPEAADLTFALTVLDLAACEVTKARDDLRRLEGLDPAAALVLQVAGIHDIIDRDWRPSGLAVARVLFVAQDTKPLFTSQALEGLKSSTSDAARAAIQDQETRLLQREIKEVRLQLADLTRSTARGLAKLEEKSSQTEVEIKLLEEKAFQSAADIAKLEKVSLETAIEIKTLRESQLQEFLKLQTEIKHVGSAIRLTDHHVDGLAFKLAQLSTQVDSRFQELEDRVRRKDERTLAALNELTRQASTLAATVYSLQENDREFARAHHDEIQALTNSLRDLQDWRAAIDAKTFGRSVVGLSKSLFDLGATALASKIVNVAVCLIDIILL